MPHIDLKSPLDQHVIETFPGAFTLDSFVKTLKKGKLSGNFCETIKG